jgi:hypothetical protein
MGDYTLFIWPIATGAFAAIFSWLRYRSIMNQYKAGQTRSAARHTMAE